MSLHLFAGGRTSEQVTDERPTTAADRLVRGIAPRLSRYCSRNRCSQSDAMAALEKLERGTLSRRESRILSVRVPSSAVARIEHLSRSTGVGAATLIRLALSALDETNAAANSTATAALSDLLIALDLDPSTDVDTIMSAIGALVSQLQGESPVPSTSKPAPPKPSSTKTPLAPSTASLVRATADEIERKHGKAARERYIQIRAMRAQQRAATYLCKARHSK